MSILSATGPERTQPLKIILQIGRQRTFYLDGFPG